FFRSLVASSRVFLHHFGAETMSRTLPRGWKNRLCQVARRAPRPASRRPVLEALEDRWVPSSMTFPVTSAADTAQGMPDIPGTLRWAIDESNANPVQGQDKNQITFSIGTGPQTIALLNNLPAITQPVILDAIGQPGYSPGQPAVTVDAQNLWGGFVVSTGKTTIKGLNIINVPGLAISLISGS